VGGEIGKIPLSLLDRKKKKMQETASGRMSLGGERGRLKRCVSGLQILKRIEGKKGAIGD